jgi:hypothetical protein
MTEEAGQITDQPFVKCTSWSYNQRSTPLPSPAPFSYIDIVTNLTSVEPNSFECAPVARSALGVSET